ncbi:MAG: hypothetical protein R3271_10415 [Methylophaga sp.]|nr:hypothetical protein [Methylophaga sp.]MDX1750723.1 hypothetical protein [Methylophaga sp.]
MITGDNGRTAHHVANQGGST